MQEQQALLGRLPVMCACRHVDVDPVLWTLGLARFSVAGLGASGQRNRSRQNVRTTEIDCYIAAPSLPTRVDDDLRGCRGSYGAAWMMGHGGSVHGRWCQRHCRRGALAHVGAPICAADGSRSCERNDEPGRSRSLYRRGVMVQLAPPTRQFSYQTVGPLLRGSRSAAERRGSSPVDGQGG